MLRTSICSLLFAANVSAYPLANANLIKLIHTADTETRWQLETKQAQLAEILAHISTQTGIAIHYTVLPEGLVTATCVGATLKQVVECVLARKANLIVRLHPQTDQPYADPAAEMWVLGVRYVAATACADVAKEPEKANLIQAETSDAPPLDELLNQTQSQDANTRANAIGALLSVGKAGDERIKNVLLVALTDPEAIVRAQAISSFARREGEAATAALQNALHDSDAGVRLMAVDGIGTDADLLRQAIDDEDATVRQLALSKLAALKKDRHK